MKTSLVVSFLKHTFHEFRVVRGFEITSVIILCVGAASCFAADEQSLLTGEELGAAYQAQWNQQLNDEIDARIEKYRKCDALAKGFAPGSTVRIHQVESAFLFGANLFNFDQFPDHEKNLKYRQGFRNLFNAATIGFYWKNFEPVRGQNRFQPGPHDTEEFWATCPNPTAQNEWRRPAPEPLLRFCEENGIAVHGHVMIYPPYHPSWLLQLHGADLDAAYRKRIRDLAEYYKGRIPQWDIVNESVNRSCTSEAPNDDICWGRKNLEVPKDYTFTCFQEAAKMLPPSVKLVINDSWRPIYPPFIRSLLARGAKIDVVGIQMHIFSRKAAAQIARGEKITPNNTSWDPADQIRMLKDLDTLGRPIHLSEITISAPEENPRGEEIQARLLRDNYRLWFSWPSINRITYWNVVDHVGLEILPSGFFAKDMRPKAVAWALDRLVNHEWRTNMTCPADADGAVRFRGFKGKYLLSGTGVDGKPLDLTITVQ
ncbi:MAG: endo-1,4-beta-xylanase [Kiritimatiellae bacterium]|nr:endo-1,4-beta-xylanase [Kiritimatiellia bacterium]